MFLVGPEDKKIFKIKPPENLLFGEGSSFCSYMCPDMVKAASVSGLQASGCSCHMAPWFPYPSVTSQHKQLGDWLQQTAFGGTQTFNSNTVLVCSSRAYHTIQQCEIHRHHRDQISDCSHQKWSQIHRFPMKHSQEANYNLLVETY